VQLDLQLCDVVLTSSPKMLGRLIRRAERSPGEDVSHASHAGLIIQGGPWRTALISEAVGRGVCVRTLHPYAADGTPIKILRPLGLTHAQLDAITTTALAASDEGRRYGFGQLVLHGMDALLTRVRGREVVLFRKGINAKRFTTCARHVAQSFRAAGLDFGADVDLVTPDHVDDWAADHPDKYATVWDWAPLPPPAG
jgi:hypothetical protein